MEEIIEMEINDYIDPNERRKIEKDKIKSEETLSDISEDIKSEHGDDEKKQRKSKKQLKREKRLKKEINKGKYTLVENNEERRWFNGRKLIWEDEKEKILKINEIECELLEKRLNEFLEKNIQEEMNKKLLQKEIKEREEKHLKWDAHKKALNDFGLFIYNWIPNSHQDNEQTKNIAKFVMSGSHRLRTATANSDIDGIILVPYKFYWESQFVLDFLGDFDCIEKKCVSNLKENVVLVQGMENGDNSLFCKLCEHPSVENLKRIFGRVPIIGLKFGGFEFDLLFVTLEANTIDKYFKEENSLTVTQVDEAIKELTQNIRDIDRLSPKRRGMVSEPICV
uniref:DNA polymerase n=1 Tax=Meloidogyne javanica TaxID=6303 RepID=A0A915M3L6_MELJA